MNRADGARKTRSRSVRIGGASFLSCGREHQKIKNREPQPKHFEAVFAARRFSGQAGHPEPRNKLFCALLCPKIVAS
jgi:hypothetical protein